MDGRYSIASHRFPVTARCCDQAITDNEQAMMLSTSELLDHHILRLTIFDGPVVSFFDFVSLGQFNGDAPLMVCVFGFDDHWQSDF